jgi:hypothetical protein
MSLHKFAEQVAANGRGDDSLLVHMTPDEVQRLQQFAQANGRSLTINPETGLPEAGILSDLFKAVAPIALGAFLGPGAFGIAGMGLSAGAAGLVTGGLTTLATGSLSRGLMAGLGAYGGAGLAQGFADAGVGAGMSEALAGSSSGNLGQAFGDVASIAGDGSSGQAFNEFLKSSANPATMSASELASSGLKAAATDPMAFAKQNFGNITAAAAPIMAGAMVPTTTKLPENTNPAYIRQKLYDPYTQTYKSLEPVKASEFGSRSFSDAYTNPQTGQMATLDTRKPSPMAGGGIVALAGGGTGVPTYFVNNPDVAKAYTENTYGLTPEQFAYTHAQKYGNAEMASGQRAPTTQSAGAAYAAANNIDLQKNINDWIVNNPSATAADVNKALASSGLTQTDVNPYLTANTNLSDAARYSLSHLNEIDGLSGLQKGVMTALARNPNMTQSEIDVAQAQYKLSDYDIQSPLIHGYQVDPNQTAAAQQYLKDNADVRAWLDSTEGKAYLKENPQFDKNDIAYTHFQRYGKDEGRKFGLPSIASVVPGGTRLDTATTYDNGAFGNYGSGNQTAKDSNGNLVSIATPGDVITNPDNSRTVVPNTPGRPYGGFTGMEGVKSAYTAGGGSLGYTAQAPKTMAEFNEMYNKQTGDSLAAYDYLMGKGGGKYPVQSQAASTAEGIMRPYFSAGMKYKPRFLTAGKDGTVTESSTNPNAPKSGGSSSGKLQAKAINVLDSQGNTVEATLRDDGNYHTSEGKKYDVAGAEIVADGGMMGYAMGGGLGSLGSYSDGGRLLKGPGDGVSDSIPATIGSKQQPARLADGEFVIPARIVSELGNGSTDAGAKKLYAMMDRVQRARGKTTGKNKVAANSRADKHLPA